MAAKSLLFSCDELIPGIEYDRQLNVVTRQVETRAVYI